jgi:hypothetical protein
MLHIFHIKKIYHGTYEEISKIFFLGARKYHQSFRIELLCGQHGSYGIKVGIQMSGDDGQVVFQGQSHIFLTQGSELSIQTSGGDTTDP